MPDLPESVDAISQCKAVSRFMDRDTVPDLANAMITQIQSFIDDPSPTNVSSIRGKAEQRAGQ